MLAVVVGVVVLPMVWIWRRHSDSLARRRALTLLLLFVTFDLVVFGAFTRLSDSGLGCPDWPGCYGSGTPLGASEQIAAAQSAMPSGPVTHAKAWIEMLHRYLASVVGALILILTTLAWRQRKQFGGVWLPSLTLVWVCVQGAFGALTVTMKLYPAIVTLHLLGGVVLLMMLGVQAAAYFETLWPRLPRGLTSFLYASLALLMLQIALGGWVSTNYAVLACSEFPMCQGQWWPSMNFQQGFEIWRGLGVNASGQPIGFEALTAIHYVHRVMAYVVVLVLAVLTVKLLRAGWTRPARHLAWLTALQVLTGLSNVVLGWPMLAALMHTAGAAALALLLSWFAAKARTVSGTGHLVSSNAPSTRSFS